MFRFDQIELPSSVCGQCHRPNNEKPKNYHVVFDEFKSLYETMP